MLSFRVTFEYRRQSKASSPPQAEEAAQGYTALTHFKEFLLLIMVFLRKGGGVTEGGDRGGVRNTKPRQSAVASLSLCLSSGEMSLLAPLQPESDHRWSHRLKPVMFFIHT